MIREIERIDAELSALRQQAEAAGESAAWLSLGDGAEERAEGAAWQASADALQAAITALETRRFELQLKL